MTSLAPLQRIWATCKLQLAYVRLTRFDVTSPNGHADERKRRIALTALASMLAKFISVSTALITVPLTLNYLGAERYGMWLILSSLSAMFTFADMGIGNGILNQVTIYNGRDDVDGIHDVVSSGFVILTLIPAGLLAIFAAAYAHVGWYHLFNVHSALARSESGPAMAAFVLSFALAMPLSIVQKVQIGLQMGFMSSLWQCLSSILGLICVLIAIAFKASIFWLVLGFMGGPLIMALCNSVWFFGYHSRQIAPRLSRVGKLASSQICRIGGNFFLLQIVAAATYTTDAIILAQVVGASVVAQYSVPEKLFSIIAMVLLMLMSPLWPAYGEAVARGDHAWAKATLKKSLLFSLVFSAVGSTLLIVFAPFIFRIWVHGKLQPPLLLMIGLGIWKVIEGQGNALAMFFNGTNQLRFLFVISIFTAVTALILKIALAKLFGVSGTVWGTIIAFGIFMLIPSYLRARWYFRDARTVPV